MIATGFGFGRVWFQRALWPKSGGDGPVAEMFRSVARSPQAGNPSSVSRVNLNAKAQANKPFVSLQEWLRFRPIPASWDLSTATSYRVLRRCNARNRRAPEIASEARRKRGGM